MIKKIKKNEHDLTYDDLRVLSFPGEEIGTVTEDVYGVSDSDGYGGVYRDGCHTYNLHDQEDDASNSTESGGYDESSGPPEIQSRARLRTRRRRSAERQL